MSWSEEKLWKELEKSYRDLLTISNYREEFLSSINVPTVVENKYEYLNNMWEEHKEDIFKEGMGNSSLLKP